VRPPDSNDNFGDWSPSVGMLYRFSPTMALFGGVARGFRAPQTSELYRLQDNQTDADLDSVEMDSVELGFRGNWADTSLEAAIFHMDKKNDIFQDSNRQNVDGGETSHRGVEAQLVHRLTDTLDIAASGTYALHRYENNIEISNEPIKGNDVDTAPKYLAWLKLGWDYAPAVRTELEWVHTGSYYLEPNNIAKYSGHDLLNLRCQYDLDDNWLLSARVTNLLDRNYADRADYAFGEYRYFVGLPRSLYLAISRGF
jgi:iron complex outermembrane recepter protein